jgi:hypothetical protein
MKHGASRTVSLLLVYAAILTVWGAYVIAKYDLAPLFLALQPIVFASAWAAPWAWANRRWGLAAIALSLTFAAPWGYLYPAPAMGLILAGIATGKFVRGAAQKAGRREPGVAV